MKKIIGAITFMLATNCAFAVVNTVAKEDMTPPPMEGALTASQIQPIITMDKTTPNTTKKPETSAPASAPATVPAG